MSVQTTPNLGLTLPYQTDPVAVSTQNDNMTIIDTAYGSLNSKLGAFARFANDFTSVSPGKIDDVITNLPNNAIRGLLFTWYNGYTFTNSASVYLIQRSSTQGDWYAKNQIYKGSEGRTVTLANDGTLTKGDSNSYNVRVVFLMLSN